MLDVKSRISSRVSRSLKEYTIITSHTPRGLTYNTVDLSVELAPNVVLHYPFIAAAMACVSGDEMTAACAYNGIMAVVPCSFSQDDQARIIRDVKKNNVKKGDIQYVDEPVWIRDTETVSAAISRYDEHGHSTIPIGDRHQKLLGIFRYKEGITGDLMNLQLSEAVTMARSGNPKIREIVDATDLSPQGHGNDYCHDTDDVDFIDQSITGDKRFIPIVDKSGLLKKLAFRYRFDSTLVGAALHTHPGWEKRAEALYEAGPDMFFFDASHGDTDYEVDALKVLKARFPDVPICAGNVITGEGYKCLVDAGADVVKAGMSTGESCITWLRGPGRGMATVIEEIVEEREKGRKAPIIADGGIGTRKIRNGKNGKIDDMPIRRYELDPSTVTKALAFGVNAVMMGTSFNMCEEAAGDTKEFQGKRYKRRWGEGSPEAQSLARYGVDEQVNRAALPEGVSDYVPCIGRVKPVIERLALGAAMNFVNMGAKNIADLHDKENILELMSKQCMEEMGVD